MWLHDEREYAMTQREAVTTDQALDVLEGIIGTVIERAAEVGTGSFPRAASTRPARPACWASSAAPMWAAWAWPSTGARRDQLIAGLRLDGDGRHHAPGRDGAIEAHGDKEARRSPAVPI
jgi:hypothetical protein